MRRSIRLFIATAVTGGLLAMPTTAGAAVTEDPGTAAAYASSWLTTQVTDAGFVAGPGGNPNYSATANLVLALASTGAAPGLVDTATAYLTAHVEDFVVVDGVDVPGNLAYLILVAQATGGDPTAFGGVDLVARLLATKQTTGDDTGLFGTQSPAFDGAFRQSLALLALLDTDAAVQQDALDWLLDQQCPDGGWQAYRATVQGVLAACAATDPATFQGEDSNSTAMAIQALLVFDAEPGADPFAWLEDAQDDSGGWGYLSGTAYDANSTALVIQALIAGGLDPDDAAAADGTPWDALLALQVGCSADVEDRGAFAYQPGPDGDLAANLLATLQAVPALAGAPYPIDPADPTDVVAVVPCPTVGPPVTASPTVAPPRPRPTTPPVVAPTAIARPTLPATGGRGERPWDSTGQAVLGLGLIGYGALALLGARLMRRRTG